jgi:hypothetical protein
LETWILRLKIFPSILPFAVAFAIWHCQSGENPAQPDPDANPDAVSFGAFKIILREDGKTASFLGKIYDGPQPINTLWDEKLVAGCLKVVAPRLPFCAQPCGSGFACVADDSCQAYPTAIHAGAVEVRGLITNKGTGPFSISPLNNLYQAVGLAYPPFHEGDTVQISAAGSEFSPPFALKALGFAPLKILTDTVLDYMDGKPMALEWEASAKDIHSSMDVVIDLTFHGGTKAKIEGRCDDNGKLTIPANLLDKLKTYGLSGYPRLNMTRMTKGSDANAKAELTLESNVSLGLEIPGLVSCNQDEDCPDNRACLADRRCE